jgi:hypothetical protein
MYFVWTLLLLDWIVHVQEILYVQIVLQASSSTGPSITITIRDSIRRTGPPALLSIIVVGGVNTLLMELRRVLSRVRGVLVSHKK